MSLAPVLGARALEPGRTICQTMLQWILPQWVFSQWGLVCHHLHSAWPHNQSHQSTTSHWSLPTWSLGRLWYYWSFIPSFYNASNHGSESTTLFYPGFNHISPLVPSLSTSTTSNLLLSSFYMVLLKALSLVLFFSFCTQLYLVTSFLGHQSITSSMLMTLSSSFLPLHATSNKTFNSYKTPFLKSRPGWLPTSYLSTPLKMNFYSLVFLPNSLKLIILLYLCLQALPSNLLLLLEILVLYSTLISLFLVTSHASQKPA